MDNTTANAIVNLIWTFMDPENPRLDPSVSSEAKRLVLNASTILDSWIYDENAEDFPQSEDTKIRQWMRELYKLIGADLWKACRNEKEKALLAEFEEFASKP